MLRFVTVPDAPAEIPPPARYPDPWAAGWYPDPWVKSQLRYRNREWTAWTAVRMPRPPRRKLGALDVFGVTVALMISVSGSVAFWQGVSPNASDPATTPIQPIFSNPGLSNLGALVAALGLIFSFFLVLSLRKTEGKSNELLRVLAKAGVVVPLLALGFFVLVVAGAGL